MVNMAGVYMGLIFGIRAYIQSTTYTADITFMVNYVEEGGRVGKYNYKKIIELWI
jgi:uncharacterized membrane protein